MTFNSTILILFSALVVLHYGTTRTNKGFAESSAVFCGDTTRKSSTSSDLQIFKRDTNAVDDSERNVTFLDVESGQNVTMTIEQILEEIRSYIFYPTAGMWVLICFHCIVFVVGLVGNTLVCVAVYRNHTMRTVTNYFIVNLAVADFLVILFCLPPSVVWDVTSTWFFGVAMCKVVLYLQSVSVTVSVLTLTFISIDRWYAICFPLKFKSTTGRAKTAIGIIWLLALAFDIPEAISLQTSPKEELQEIDTIYFTQCVPNWSTKTETIFLLIRMAFLYAVPLAFMTIAYVQIIKVLWKSGNTPNHGFDVSGCRHVNTFQMNMNTSTEGQLRSRRKAAKMLVVVVVMFAICYFPVHLLSVLRITLDLKMTEGNTVFSLISHWLCYVNSAVNPLIYNFMSGKFRKEFRRAFEHCCQTTRSNQLAYHLNTLYSKSMDSGLGSKTCSAYTRRNTTNLKNTCNDDLAEQSLIRKGTKTSVVRLNI